MKMEFKNLSISKKILLVAINLSIVLVVFLLSFSANQVLVSKNEIKATVNETRSTAIMEKIDRNFYERFGDVQAFAYNQLAIQAIDSSKATSLVQNFINTMVSYYVLYDLMMIVDNKGKVVAFNTLDKNGVPVKTDQLKSQDFSNEDWFRVCVSVKGPEGGAWYSDFMTSPLVSAIYQSNGRGMGFAAPIKNSKGAVVGVWYNFASWKDVTQGIRQETEEQLKKEDYRTFILITDSEGKVIDAADDKLVQDEANIGLDIVNDETIKLVVNGKEVISDDYAIGIGNGVGAYTYKGNNWKAFTFVPKDRFSFSIFVGELLTLTITTVLILLFGILAFLLLSKNISKRIKRLQEVITSLSVGDLLEVSKSTIYDEIGIMTNSVMKLVDGLRKTSMFASEIGNGNLNISFEALSEKDVLGHSLVSMRNSLVKIKVEDDERQWITEGIAEFGDKLRSNNSDIAKLCDDVLVFLCKYVKANQAAIFIKEEVAEPYMKLISCYAWERKKYVEKKISMGDGLIGQAWQEGDFIFLTDVPNNFINISSGLGDTNPSSIIMLPLKIEDEVFGVLEMASLKQFQSYEIEFLKKVTENLASSLSSVKVNERTRKLLEHSQQQTEALMSQEEEMRQNMEEITATQEEMARKEREYLKRIHDLESKHNGVLQN